MNYIVAFIAAVVMFIFTAVLIAVLIGQMLDGVRGWQQIIPALGQFGIPLSVAVVTFKKMAWPDRK